MTDATEITDSSDKLSGMGQLALGSYHALLAVLLVYVLYNVWPPQPWPKGTNESRIDAPGSKAEKGKPSPPVKGDSSPPPTEGNASNQSQATTQSAAQASPSSAAPQSPQTSLSPSPSPSPTPSPSPLEVRIFGVPFHPSPDARLILLVLIVGALGSYVHATSSFVDYVGNKTFAKSWIWWYLLRPFIGMMLALILYFAIRGGFMTPQTVNGDSEEAVKFINPYGIAALSALAGLFTKQATDKLSEVFTTLFRPAPDGGDAQRGNKLHNQVAIIKTVTPAKIKKSSAASLNLTGDNFLATSKIRIKGEDAPTKFISPNSLTVELTATHTANTGFLEITVFNPPPGGGVSNSTTIEVTEN